jgi:hypothetical protein
MGQAIGQKASAGKLTSADTGLLIEELKTFFCTIDYLGNSMSFKVAWHDREGAEVRAIAHFLHLLYPSSSQQTFMEQAELAKANGLTILLTEA